MDSTIPETQTQTPAELSVTYKLILCQAFYEFGTKSSNATKKVCKVMNEHPLLLEYAGTFTIASCVELYEELMNEMGMDPSCPLSPESQPLHDLARKYYLIRVDEVRAAMAELESRYKVKSLEIEAINQGRYDSLVPEDYVIPPTVLPVLPDLDVNFLPPLPNLGSRGRGREVEEVLPESDSEPEVVADDDDEYMG